MAFIARPSFWESEKRAPLLDRNDEFLKEEGADVLVQRASKWGELCQAVESQGREDKQDIEPLKRIFLADAERTFKSDTFRSEFVAVLERMGAELGDYHQGMGYVTSFLMLFVNAEQAFRILLRLTDEKYSQGYFRGHPETFGRDAMVFQRLLDEDLPEVGKHLQSTGVVAEAYASKWFVGLCVHVLPFEQLFEFFEAFLEQGWVFLFKFAMALVRTVAPLLLDAGSDVSKMFSILRLDAAVFTAQAHPNFFADLVAAAQAEELDVARVSKLREEEWEKLQERLERVRQRQKELDEDSDSITWNSDEGSDDEDSGVDAGEGN